MICRTHIGHGGPVNCQLPLSSPSESTALWIIDLINGITRYTHYCSPFPVSLMVEKKKQMKGHRKESY